MAKYRPVGKRRGAHALPDQKGDRATHGTEAGGEEVPPGEPAQGKADQRRKLHPESGEPQRRQPRQQAATTRRHGAERAHERVDGDADQARNRKEA